MIGLGVSNLNLLGRRNQSFGHIHSTSLNAKHRATKKMCDIWVGKCSKTSCTRMYHSTTVALSNKQTNKQASKQPNKHTNKTNQTRKIKEKQIKTKQWVSSKKANRPYLYSQLGNYIKRELPCEFASAKVILKSRPPFSQKSQQRRSMFHAKAQCWNWGIALVERKFQRPSTKFLIDPSLAAKNTKVSGFP